MGDDTPHTYSLIGLADQVELPYKSSYLQHNQVAVPATCGSRGLRPNAATDKCYNIHIAGLAAINAIHHAFSDNADSYLFGILICVFNAGDPDRRVARACSASCTGIDYLHC